LAEQEITVIGMTARQALHRGNKKFRYRWQMLEIKGQMKTHNYLL
jgi:hypothetical protein